MAHNTQTMDAILEETARNLDRFMATVSGSSTRPRVTSADDISRYMTPEWSWYGLYEPFEKRKSGAFIVCSPGKNTMYVAEANAISQITTRRNDFPKPTEIYKSVNIFGPNVVGTEGSVWRHHRKITSPPFTEKSNALVFKESIQQGQAMLESWVGRSGNEVRTVTDIAADTMRLSLYVISRAGFGVRLLWPHEEGVNSEKMPEGHTMTYKDALSSLLENIIWLIVLPRWILSMRDRKGDVKLLLITIY